MSIRWIITAALAAVIAVPALAEEATSFAPPGYAAPPSGYRYVKNNDNQWVLVLISALAGAGLGYAIGNDHDKKTTIVVNNPPPVSGQ